MMRWFLLCLGMVCTPFLIGPAREVAQKVLASRPPPAPPTAMAVSPHSSGGSIALGADERGHFLTDAVLDGRSLPMIVDTGATICALMEEDAEKLGIRLSPSSFTQTISTANGVVRVAPVRIKIIRIGPIAVRDVEAVVVPKGLLGTNLLGMSFLKRVREFSISGGRLTLRG